MIISWNRKEAVRHIVDEQDELLKTALEYCCDGKIEQVYVLGSGTSYHAAVSARKVMEETMQIKFCYVSNGVCG